MLVRGLDEMDAQDNDAPKKEKWPNFSSVQGNSWRPSAHVFRAYMPPQLHQRAFSKMGHLPRLIVNRPIMVKLTKEIVETYQSCNAAFTFSEAFNPRKCLTSPSLPACNGGLDNEKSDLILFVNGMLVNGKTNHRYIIKDLLGQGTFGQVAKCWAEERDCFVAVKIIKNQPAYHQQAVVEISILDMLNSKFDPEDEHQIVRMLEHFYYQEHLCIVFEMLSFTLFELLKSNNFKGISLNLIRTFSKQILKALSVLRDAGIIHCDLKPENILLTSLTSAEIKLIDFGSACREDRTVYSYIQSRFYRSPEVVLGHAYTTAIDMWSLGCVAAELFLGLPLFPAQSQYDLLQRMIKVLGGKPPDYILRHAKSTSKYFKIGGAPIQRSGLMGGGQCSAYHFLTPDDIELKEKERPSIGKHYFPEDWDLEKLILSYHMKKGMRPEEVERERNKRLVFVDFLKWLVNMDPLKRLTPNQAKQHPFLTEKPFTGSFQPPLEAPRLPIHQGRTVDHNPVSGHWFGAGLSPQVTSNVAFQFGSPQYSGLPPSYGSSYGVGSYGSFGDGGAGPGSSFGSNGDALESYINHRTPPNASFGISPDTWHRKGHMPPNAFGYAHLGMSPSGGAFLPMSLGASPSNLTSPNSHFQLSPGSPSTGSSSRFGPTSPARSGGGGGGGSAAALGKAAAFGQYYRRRGLGSPGSVVNANSESRSFTHEGSLTPSYGAYDYTSTGNGESSSNSQIEGLLQNSHLGSPRSPSHHASQFRQKNGVIAGSNSLQGQTSHVTNYPVGSLGEFVSKRQVTLGGEEDTSPPPNPGDWDPNYSEDLLFESDGGDMVSSNVSAVGSSSEAVATSGAHVPGPLNTVPMPDSGGTVHHSMQLQGGLQAAGYRPANMMPFYMDGGSPASHGYGLNAHRPSSYGHHSQQISPSRLGQQAPQFLQQQHQQQYQYYFPSVHLSEQLSIPFSVTQPQLGHQFFSQSTHATASYSLPYILPGAPEPAQGMHLYNQMTSIAPSHWASGFPGQRPVMKLNEQYSGRRNGALNGVFPPIPTNKDRRTDV